MVFFFAYILTYYTNNINKHTMLTNFKYVCIRIKSTTFYYRFKKITIFLMKSECRQYYGPTKIADPRCILTSKIKLNFYSNKYFVRTSLLVSLQAILIFDSFPTEYGINDSHFYYYVTNILKYNILNLMCSTLMC